MIPYIAVKMPMGTITSIAILTFMVLIMTLGISLTRTMIMYIPMMMSIECLERLR